MPRAVVTARENLRLLNQRAVLQTVHRYDQISRSDLAAELHLSPATVTDITALLIDRGILYEARAGTSSTVGRKPILLQVNYNHAAVLGIKLSSTAVITVLTNLKAEVLARRTDLLQTLEPEAVVTVIQEAAEALLHCTSASPETLVGVGVSLPGIVEPDTGTCRYSALLGWREVPLGPLLKDRLERTTFIDNDVNALAAAEAWFAQAKRHQDFLVVTLGQGIGLGIIIGGAPYRGPQGGAGEFGHLALDVDGPLCTCGNRGCLEAYLADEALVKRAREQIPAFRGATIEALVALADTGDADARALFAEAGRLLGRALSGLVNIFAPSLVVLSGEGMRAAHLLLPETRASLEAHCFGDLYDRVELLVNTWGDDAWARGAAGLAARQYLFEVADTLGGEP